MTVREFAVGMRPDQRSPASAIRKDPPPIGQRITLSQPELSFGELASEHTGSCVIAIPIDPDAPPIGSPANSATALMTAVPRFPSNQYPAPATRLADNTRIEPP
jgi:hypothetical protein